MNIELLKQKYNKKIKLTKQKVQDLHHLGNLLSRADGDFQHWYPHLSQVDMGEAEADHKAAESTKFELGEFIHACCEYGEESDKEETRIRNR